MLAQARLSPLRRAATAVPRDAVYINTGQVLLGWPWFFGWLERRPDVKPVLMMHDLIPVLHPEYSGPILSRHHARALRTVAHRAAAMLATSHASADEIRNALAGLGRHDMPIHVVPLPVSDSLTAPAGHEAPSAAPYFVTVGIIDQRKNHLLLLHAWREMMRQHRPLIPKLVIVGSRGLRVEGLADFIERSPGLAEHVIEVNGLSTPAMRELIRGARAVLMPSFTEGFGLPVVEALALGTPVVASDIPAHREVGGALASYLHPLDGLGWMREVLRRAAENAAALQARRMALKGYRVQSWSTYFDEVFPFIEAL
jgi:glycosyltransferase involved in cell wall biosynthesis